MRIITTPEGLDALIGALDKDFKPGLAACFGATYPPEWDAMIKEEELKND